MKYYVNVDNGDTYWYKDARMKVLHRENGPAVEGNSGYTAWYINGVRHREDGPAVVSYGYKKWYSNGYIHREDGPAVEYSYGAQEWWLNGNQLTEEEFNAKMNPVIELTAADIEKLLGKKVKIVR